MFHGLMPYEGTPPVDAARAAAYERRRPILGTALPAEIGVLLRDCWHPTPSNRPIFEEIINRLEPLHDRLLSEDKNKKPEAEVGCACVVQ